MPRILLALFALLAAGCSDRDAWLPPADIGVRTEISLEAGGAVLVHNVVPDRFLTWHGGDWALSEFGRLELLRTDRGMRRAVVGPFDRKELSGFRLVSGGLVFRRSVPAGRRYAELWWFDPWTATPTRLSARGVDRLEVRPGDETLVVRSWRDPRSTGFPDQLQLIEPVSGRVTSLPHLEGYDYARMQIGASGDWYFVPEKAGRARLAAVPLTGGPASIVDEGLTEGFYFGAIRAGVVINSLRSLLIWRPPAPPVRILELAADEEFGAGRAVLGGGAAALEIDAGDAGMEILLLDADSGELRTLSDGFGLRHIEAVSPDGRWLFEVRRQARDDLDSPRYVYVHDLSDPLAEVREAPWVNDSIHGFSADSRSVLVFSGELYAIDSFGEPVTFDRPVKPAVVTARGALGSLGGLGGLAGR